MSKKSAKPKTRKPKAKAKALTPRQVINVVKTFDAEQLADIDRSLYEAMLKDAQILAITNLEARYLVDTYYSLQTNRIEMEGKRRNAAKDNQPTLMLDLVLQRFERLEKAMIPVLLRYSEETELGRWLLQIKGIGAVLAAGLLANIQPREDRTVSDLWSYAGYNPSATWGKKELRPWNARLKVLCWKIGESFTMVSGNEKSLYGRLYAERKVQEIARNEALAFADQAKAALAAKTYKKETEAYKAYIVGKLPDKQILLRAQRIAVKMFLSHFLSAQHLIAFGKMPPSPWVMAHGGHAHLIQPEVPYPHV